MCLQCMINMNKSKCFLFKISSIFPWFRTISTNTSATAITTAYTTSIPSTADSTTLTTTTTITTPSTTTTTTPIRRWVDNDWKLYSLSNGKYVLKSKYIKKKQQIGLLSAFTSSNTLALLFISRWTISIFYFFYFILFLIKLLHFSLYSIHFLLWFINKLHHFPPS